MEGIKLVNIDLSGISELDQMDKVKEEEIEFREAFLEYINQRTEPNKTHVMDEYLDRMQAPLGLLNMYDISAQDIMDYYPIWIKKLAHRPREKECIKCGYKKNCCLYQSSEWAGDQEAETCESYYDEVR